MLCEVMSLHVLLGWEHKLPDPSYAINAKSKNCEVTRTLENRTGCLLLRQR